MVTGAVPANARRLFGSVNRAGSSPISAKTRAARTGPSPGAERRIAACGCGRTRRRAGSRARRRRPASRRRAEQPAHRGAERGLDPFRLAQRGRAQVGEDLLDEHGVVAAAGALQQRDQLAAGQLRRSGGGRRRGEDGDRGLVLEVRKRVQRLRIELQQHRPQAAEGLVKRPDRLLVLAGQRLDRAALLADRGRGRCRCRSVRRMSASTSASPGSDLPPACPCVPGSARPHAG